MDHTTVAAHLRALRDEDDPLIDLIENDRGLAGDLYQLRIPDDIAPGQHGSPGGPGNSTPCGRCSGNSATPPRSSTKPSNTPSQPQRSFDLTTTTGLSRPAVHDALRNPGGVEPGHHPPRPVGTTPGAGASLQLLAEQFGCVETVRALVNRHRDERAAYRRALRIVDQHHIVVAEPTDSYLWPPEPPPAETETLLELLHRELGAYLIGA